MNKLISVIMPVYNSSRFMQKAVKSVISQSYNNLELIIVDDGSTDETEYLCRKLCQEDNRIKYYRKGNGGVSSARNEGLTQVRGEYVTFIDADDWYSENYLKTMMTLMSGEVELVLCNYARVYAISIKLEKTGLVRGIYEPNIVIEKMLTGKFMGSVWRCLFPSAAVKKIKFKKVKFAEDMLFILEYIQSIKKICYCEEALYFYNKLNDSCTTANAKRRAFVDDYLALPNLIGDLLKKYGNLNTATKRLIALEYVKSAVRVCPIISYTEFKKHMTDPEYRKYISLYTGVGLSPPVFLLYISLKHGIYFPYKLVKAIKMKITY